MQYQIACGLPSVPRSTFPSMFQILSSPLEQPSLPNAQHPASSTLPLKAEINNNKIDSNITEKTISQSKYTAQNRKVSKSANTKYQLYHYKQDQIKRSQSVIQQSSAEKIPASTKKVTHKKKLDPNNKDDVQQIEARKKRIKKFQYVTRDLPNSAFTTYFGKPTFQTYGRANSNPNLLTHNVMPHKGANNPKNVQSYYTALLKAKKHANSTFIPRKPVEETTEQYHQKPQIPIHIPLQTPDLINNIRFTSQKMDRKKDASIPTHKISPMTQKISKKKARPQNKRKNSPASKDIVDLDDGLKYINTRENLLKIIQEKKHNGSKLAYKVTECYPFEWQNQQKAKQMTQSWVKVLVAGKPSVKGDPVSVLLHQNHQIN